MYRVSPHTAICHYQLKLTGPLLKTVYQLHTLYQYFHKGFCRSINIRKYLPHHSANSMILNVHEKHLNLSKHEN